jgi:hypothetical protein
VLKLSNAATALANAITFTIKAQLYNQVLADSMTFSANVNEVCHAVIMGTAQTRTSYSYDIGVDGTVVFEFDAFQLSLPCGKNLVSY